MSNINNECKINGAIDAITIEKTELITNQMKNCICKIEGREQGTGFFCKIKYKENIIPVLITNTQILENEFIKLNKKVKISTNDEKNIKIINIDEDDIIYISSVKNYNIIIIKLKEYNEFNNNLEIDESIFNNNSEKAFENKSIYILHYPKGEKACVSYGYGISKVGENNNFRYKCNINSGSSGAPIMNLETNKIIGIHRGIYLNTDFTIGTFIKYPLNEIDNLKGENNEKLSNQENIDDKEAKNIQDKNEIKIELKINKEDINKNIYFLDNTIFNSYLNELNETNTEIYINENKFKYKKFFIPDKEGIYKIKLILNTFVKDCSHMFYGCENIINIDLSFFVSKNVKNMSYMFYDCYQLEQINLSTFDTQNATNMESMFDNCISMENLNLSSFNTKNVTNMMYMFAGCKKLKSIDLSSFNTKNVENIDLIFYDCLNLNQIKINSEFCDKIIDIIKSSNIEIIKT